MTAQTAKAVHVRITGRVQGVGYRAWTIDEARHRCDNSPDAGYRARLSSCSDMTAIMS